MHRKAEVVHAVVAVREAEVDIASAEFYGLRLVLVSLVGPDDGRVVDGLAVADFQHAALNPYLIGAGQYGHVVQQYGVAAVIGENQLPRLWVEQGFQLSVQPFYLVELDVFGGLVGDKVEVVVVLLVRNVELLGHGSEHGIGLKTIFATELHETQQQQCTLVGQDLSVQTGADGRNGILTVQVVRHLVGHAHVAVQVEVEIGVSDAEVMTQIAHEHVLCPCFIHLLLFAKQGKQADEAG